MSNAHPKPAFHPDTLIGNIDRRLAISGLYRPDWPLTLDHLQFEVITVLVDWGWPDAPPTYERAKNITKVISRRRVVTL